MRNAKVSCQSSAGRSVALLSSLGAGADDRIYTVALGASGQQSPREAVRLGGTPVARAGQEVVDASRSPLQTGAPAN